MSSTEIVRLGQANEFGKQVKFPRTVEELAGYFAGSNLVDDNRFRNFEPVAGVLVSSLDSMAALSRTNDTEVRLIPFNPAASKHEPASSDFLSVMNDQDAYKLRAADTQIESQALVDMSYLLTQAEELYDTRRSGTGYVVMHGTHSDSHVYFVENYLRDEQGDYMLWSVASGVPEAVHKAEQGRRIEAEREIFRKAVEEGLKDLPVVELDQVHRPELGKAA